ncbi:hypothetical protein [Anaeroselena agilis]|uniref:Uncharacterized protein n=1 Tax=Anaeroselena agilis TaxID=3063788 RepID=A0ABU3NXI4_9FIRM|nr:hypothetical protein [Selenomonadales bacterium 4137-cl]
MISPQLLNGFSGLPNMKKHIFFDAVNFLDHLAASGEVCVFCVKHDLDYPGTLFGEVIIKVR